MLIEDERRTVDDDRLLPAAIMERQSDDERNWREDSRYKYDKIEDSVLSTVNDKSPTYSTTDEKTKQMYSQIRADFDQSGPLSRNDSDTGEKILSGMQSASKAKSVVETPADHCACKAADEVPNVEAVRRKRTIVENENCWNSKFRKLQCRMDEQEKQQRANQIQFDAQHSQLCELRTKVDSQQDQLHDQQLQLLAKQAQIDAHEGQLVALQMENVTQRDQLNRQQDGIERMQGQIISQQMQIDVLSDQIEIVRKQRKIDAQLYQMETQRILQRQQVVPSDNDAIVPPSSQQPKTDI